MLSTATIFEVLYVVPLNFSESELPAGGLLSELFLQEVNARVINAKAIQANFTDFILVKFFANYEKAASRARIS